MNKNNSLARVWLAALAFTMVVAGCTVSPGVGPDWEELLADVREFQRRIGFVPTKNFRALVPEQDRFPFCGYAERGTLPYSYEDPAIRWLASATEADCRELAKDHDTYFGSTEAIGEKGTPVTPAMVEGKFDRFLYVVIHEDCHDQFDLPYGIEEALCNVITYRAMVAFSAEKYKRYTLEGRVLRRYAEEQTEATRAAIAVYAQAEALYQRHARGELNEAAFLRERNTLLRRAARPLRWVEGEIGPIRLANDMTYSRHYPYIESVHDALGGDLARTVAFFRHVDKLKPDRAAFQKRQKLRDQDSVEFLRAYETAVLDVARQALPKFP